MKMAKSLSLLVSFGLFLGYIFVTFGNPQFLLTTSVLSWGYLQFSFIVSGGYKGRGKKIMVFLTTLSLSLTAITGFGSFIFGDTSAENRIGIVIFFVSVFMILGIVSDIFDHED